MEKLIELSQLVTGFITPENARSLFKERGGDPKAYRLFDGILKGRYKTDEAAARHLYDSNASEKKYQMLKSRTKSKLLQLVFSMDLSRRIKSEYIKALHSCNKSLFSCKELISIGYRSLVYDDVRKTFQKAHKYEFTEIELACSQLLRDHEAFVGNIKRIEEYNQLIIKLKSRLDVELESERYFQTIRSLFRHSVSARSDSHKIAKKCYDVSKQLLNDKTNLSNLTKVNAFKISIYFHHLNNNHLHSLGACNAYEKYLLDNPHLADLGALASINAQKLDTALYLRDYDLGKRSAEKCLKIFNKKVINWTIVQGAYFLLCLHTDEYLEAYRVFTEVESNKRLIRFPKEQIERWRIFEAFLSYILPSDRRRKQFNIHRFVNEVPVFSKDKIGYNFSIIVAQVILLVKAGDFDRVMDKYESLKAYARRHISLERSPRSHYFVKMLLTMIKYDFDPVKTESIAAKYFDKLKAARIGNQGELETLEVIPYDVLWPDLLQKLRVHKSSMIPV